MREFSEEQERDLGWGSLTYEDSHRMHLCTRGKPLLMVIPPEGTTISCPIHPAGHFCERSADYLDEFGEG